MKTERIAVNKTAERPEGVTIELVVPETPLESRVLGFLMQTFIRQAKQQGQIEYDLPESFTVEHQSEGTFVLSTTGGVDEKSGGLYQAPKPVGIVGIRTAGNHFDLVHAQIDFDTLKQQAAARAEHEAATSVPNTAKPASDESKPS